MVEGKLVFWASPHPYAEKNGAMEFEKGEVCFHNQKKNPDVYLSKFLLAKILKCWIELLGDDVWHFI